jgi:hypothetical protein
MDDMDKEEQIRRTVDEDGMKGISLAYMRHSLLS